jgi:hypothetical protein
MAGTAGKSALVLLLPLLFVGVASGQSISSNQAQACLEAARRALGPTANVAKCGHLTRTAALETVAVVKLRHPPKSCGGVAVSKLEVLREHEPQWNVELTLERWAHNQVGYVGLDFIDDTQQFESTFAGHCVWLSDHIDEGKTGFTIFFNVLYRNGEMEGWGPEVAWNPSIGRFQEYREDGQTPPFKSEIKNPERLSEILRRRGCRDTEKQPCDKR